MSIVHCSLSIVEKSLIRICIWAIDIDIAYSEYLNNFMYIHTTQAASLFWCDPQTQSVSSLLCRRLGEALFAVRRQSLWAQSVARRDFELCSCGTRTKISSRRLRKLLIEGRVVGAYKSGRYWLIPLHNGMPIIKKAKRGQAGTWKTSKKPQKLIVHINSNLIKQNMKESPEKRKPVIAIKGAQKSYVHQLEISAPCRVVYNPDKPLPCGAKVWIEVMGVHLDLMASRCYLCVTSVYK